MSKKVSTPFITSSPAAALSVTECAAYFRISRASTYRLFKSGALKPIKIGGRTVVRRADADAFLASCVGAA